jgi:NADPH:quinone reductase-like Zn-dependent oxidoreductase
MRAVEFIEYGPPEVLRLADVEPPAPRRDEVRVAVRASSLVPGDMRVRSGQQRSALPARFPYRTGFDAAGVVDALGDDVTGVSIGDEVYGFAAMDRRGTNAETAVLAAWAPKPAAWSWEEAGAAAGSIETATRVLDRLAVGAGDVLLVHGASGSVGSVATQLAVARGATVIGTAGESNLACVRTLGAAAVVDGHASGLAERVGGLAPRGVHAVFDTVGGVLPELIAIAGGPHRVVTIADMTAPRHGVHLSHGAPPDVAAAIGVPADPAAPHGLAAALPLAEQGRLSIAVAAAFPLTEVVAAARTLEQPHPRGKVVLTVPPSR